jgi:outer membrane protein assembly factor BamB
MEKVMNDEIRMTNDESNLNVRMTNDRNRRGMHASCLRFSHSVIRHLSLIRHSSFVIRASLIVAMLGGISVVRGDWLQSRGGPMRTGTQEMKAPMIKAPKVRWAFKSQEHFVAAPVPGGNLMIVSGLGAFNTAGIHAVAMDDIKPGKGAGANAAVIRAGSPVWSKSSPFIKLPTVSAPAIYDNMVIMGDGMHTTDGGALYSFDLKTGRALWRYDVDGKLVHMEGSPVVDPTYPGGTAVFIGAGDGGVIAVEANKVTLDGKQMTVAELRPIMEQKWGELMAKYEEKKKTDPDFAVPPDDSMLPKAVPVKLWQKGEKKWHVDAPLALTPERIIVCSAYLDDEKEGDRAVICLDRKTGEIMWERPVDMNPWAGASVDGDTVVVGCSSVRFDKNTINGAKGALVGIDISRGTIKYVRPMPGGILSSVAIRDGVAFFTVTDGTVRAVNVLNGRPKWTYKAKNPFFAGPAVAGGLDNGGVVYAADLGGELYALSFEDGRLLWSHNVGTDPIVSAPGMVFGSPMVRGQEIFLATCNLQGEHADQPCAVVAVSDKDFDPGVDLRPHVKVDFKHRRLEIPAMIAPRKLPSLKDIYPLEVVCTWPTPAGQKAHETVVITEVKPSEVQRGLEQLGLKPGKPSNGPEEPQGPEVKLSLVLMGPSGRERVVPMEKAIVDLRTGRSLPELSWRFTGSSMRQPDPNSPTKIYGADLTGTFATIYPVTSETVIQADLGINDQSSLKLELNKNVVPEENTPVKFWIEVK